MVAMAITHIYIHRSFIFSKVPSISLSFSCPLGRKKSQRNNGVIICAKKRPVTESSDVTQNKPIFPLQVSNPILVKSAIAVFGLGFIDAGYSGDWSRIGVISKDTEDLLKFAAFLVVPLCIFAILSISKKSD